MLLTRRTLLAVAGAIVASPAAAQTAVARWRPRAPLPWTAQEIYCAVWRGRIVVAGGLRGRVDAPILPLANTAIYDPSRDRWAVAPSLPSARHHPALAAVRGRVYAFGGYQEAPGGQWRAITGVQVFDGRQWTPGLAMPGPQSETVALAHGDAVHLIGGRAPSGESNARWEDQADVAQHRVFDAREGRWRDARPAPTARNSAAGAVIDGALYVVGGRTVRGGNLGTLERYDPATDRWATLASMPQGSGGLAAAALAGRLYAFGGEFFGPGGGGGVHPQTWIYDPARDAWTAGPAMLTPRHGLAAASVGGALYAISGATRASARDTSAVVEALIV